MRFYMSQTDDRARKQTPTAPENGRFAVSLIHLELKRECKNDDVEVGEGKVQDS